MNTAKCIERNNSQTWQTEGELTKSNYHPIRKYQFSQSHCKNNKQTTQIKTSSRMKFNSCHVNHTEQLGKKICWKKQVFQFTLLVSRNFVVVLISLYFSYLLTYFTLRILLQLKCRSHISIYHTIFCCLVLFFKL